MAKFEKYETFLSESFQFMEKQFVQKIKELIQEAEQENSVRVHLH